MLQEIESAQTIAALAEEAPAKASVGEQPAQDPFDRLLRNFLQFFEVAPFSVQRACQRGRRVRATRPLDQERAISRSWDDEAEVKLS